MADENDQPEEIVNIRKSLSTTSSVGVSSTKCCSKFRRKFRGGRREVEPVGCWVTLVASFGMNVLVAALECTFPLFYEPLLHKYDSSRASVATSASLMVCCGCLGALLCAPLIDLYGCRLVSLLGSVSQFVGLLLSAFAPNISFFHVFFGVTAGIGWGSLYISSLTIVQQKFTWNRGLATGLSLLGYSAGTILGPVLFEYLLSEYSLRGTLLLQAGVHAHSFLFAFAFKSPTKYMGAKPVARPNGDGSHESELGSKSSVMKQRAKSMKIFFAKTIDFSFCRDARFVLYVFVRMTWAVCRFCMTTHTVSASITIGVELKKARYLPAILGLSNLVFRLLSTAMLNFRWLNKEVYLTLGLVSVTMACFCAGAADGYTLMCTAMILDGCNEGLSTTSLPLVVANLVGVERFPKSLSVLEVSTFPAVMAAGPFSGWLVDISGDYFITFMFSGAMGITSTLIMAIITVLVYVDKNKSSTTEKDSHNAAVVIDETKLEPLKTRPVS